MDPTPPGGGQGGAPSRGGEQVSPSTRDRILEVALDLFVERGIEATSLREIAEQLGITKAAIYYHFAGKDDIVLALHLRLHEMMRRAFTALGELPADVASLGVLLDGLVEEMLANRKVVLFHERNRSAIEAVHHHGHDQDAADFPELIGRLLRDPALPLGDRVRLVCALGAVTAGLVVANELLEESSFEEFSGLLRQVLADILGTRR